MAYVNKPRPYDKEYQQQKARGEHERRMERQRGRRAIDKTSAAKNRSFRRDSQGNLVSETSKKERKK